MPPLPLDSRTAGVRNERLVLGLLRKQGPLSQKELCLRTTLGSSTASTIVSRLREKGLVREAQGESRSRGPKPVMLRINPRGRFLIGVELGAARLRVVLFDYLLEPVAEAEVALVSCDPEVVVALLALHVLRLMREQRVEHSVVVGLGVTVSGSVSPSGAVELSSTLGWKRVPLAELLAEHFPFPIHVLTTRVRLLAEMALETDPSIRNALYLNVAEGVGANVIIDGHLVHGASNRAGELGHVVVVPGGPTCGCGNSGCLEALVSGPALAARIREDLLQGGSSTLARSVTEEAEAREVVRAWGQAVADGDRYARELQTEVVGLLAGAVATAINLYDPQLLVIAGYVSEQCYYALEQAVHEALRTHVYDGPTRSLNIRPARAGNTRYTRGAAIRMLAEEA